jgi:hypothetical protein
MTLPVPNLDDRTFVDLVREARSRIAQACPEWTDLSVHDPGMVLVEVFAHLTEIMLYRMNRLPELSYMEFLNLLGVTRYPPSAAWTELVFTRSPGTPAGPAITIPAGTRVATTRDPVVFTVTSSAVLAAGAAEVRLTAHHCEPVEAELLGLGTGAPGQVLRARRAPLVSTTEPDDVLLGVEVGPDGPPEGATAREYGGRTYEIWRSAESFAGATPTERVYLVDRASGTVTFAPALDPTRPVADVPAAGREIRLWYRTGGGPAGNVAAGLLTTLRDPVPGVSVTNPEPARGGRAMESLDAAVIRGPYEFFSQRRAVTARDFEQLATSGSASVARARAFTRAGMWSFARPGEVEVALVPQVDAGARPDWRLPATVLVEHQVPAALAATQRELDTRRSLGTSVVTTWARYKPVAIRGRVVVRAQEDPEAVRQRIHDRLHQVLSPLPTPANPTGWAFGEPLRASNVFRLLEQAEPGVRYVDTVSFVVEEAPDSRVRAVAADHHQPDTWYAGCEATVFRSTNGGRGWEPVGHFPGETVRRVVPAPAAGRPGITPRPGAVAVVTQTEEGGSAVYLSTSLGEEWTRLAQLESSVHDLDWIDRADAGALLLATDVGLFELSLLPGATPLQVLVDSSDADRAFAAVRTFVSERGVPGVAVAAMAQLGVYLSVDGGVPGSFVQVGLSRVDVRALAVQYDGPATVLWAGAAEADPSRPGSGGYRTRLFESDVKWQPLPSGWSGGTCWGLAFQGTTAYAATQSAGVLRLDTGATAPGWLAVDVNGGLPLRDRTRFQPVECVTTGPGGGLILAGGSRGVFRSPDGQQWTAAAGRETRETVTVPDTWLICSGDHDIEVVRDDATSGH